MCRSTVAGLVHRPHAPRHSRANVLALPDPSRRGGPATQILPQPSLMGKVLGPIAAEPPDIVEYYLRVLGSAGVWPRRERGNRGEGSALFFDSVHGAYQPGGVALSGAVIFARSS